MAYFFKAEVDRNPDSSALFLSCQTGRHRKMFFFFENMDKNETKKRHGQYCLPTSGPEALVQGCTFYFKTPVWPVLAK